MIRPDGDGAGFVCIVGELQNLFAIRIHGHLAAAGDEHPLDPAAGVDLDGQYLQDS